MAKKSKNKRNINKLSNEYELIQTIIVSLIIVISLVAIAMININRIESIGKQLVGVNDYDVWEDAFKKVEKDRVGIIFNNVNTTKLEYDILRMACNEYLYSIGSKDVVDLNLLTDVIIHEKEYVDIVESEVTDAEQETDKTDQEVAETEQEVAETEQEVAETGQEVAETELNDANSVSSEDIQNEDTDNTNTDGLTEANPIYFNDMILIRYVNENGDFAVLSGAFNSEEKTIDNVSIYKQSEIKDISEKIKKRIHGEVVEKNNNTKNVMSEQEYIDVVAHYIEDLIKANSKEKLDKAIYNILPYFSYEGKEEILKVVDELAIDNNSSLEYILGIAGKSNTSKNIKDRIYIQFNVNSANENKLINIIVKLNNNLKIFDVDLI